MYVGLEQMIVDMSDQMPGAGDRRSVSLRDAQDPAEHPRWIPLSSP